MHGFQSDCLCGFIVFHMPVQRLEKMICETIPLKALVVQTKDSSKRPPPKRPQALALAF